MAREMRQDDQEFGGEVRHDEGIEKMLTSKDPNNDVALRTVPPGGS